MGIDNDEFHFVSYKTNIRLLTYVSQTLKIHHREQFPMHAKKSENAIGTNQITDTTTQNKRREE
ncbi:hypothetical protein T4A_10133, partial [Trichinella pseudospiralis]